MTRDPVPVLLPPASHDGLPDLEEHQRAVRLITEQRGFVERCLRHSGIPDADTDDLAQRVLWVAFQKINLIRMGAERAFLRAVARREAARLRRTWQRRREVPDHDDCRCTGDSVRQDELLRLRNAHAAASEVLRSMDRELRVVFEMFELHGHTSGEIAARLGLPVGTVKTRLRRARRIVDDARATSGLVVRRNP